MALAVVFTGCQGSDPDEPEKPKDVNVTGISLDRTGISMVEGETTTLTATVTPSNDGQIHNLDEQCSGSSGRQ